MPAVKQAACISLNLHSCGGNHTLHYTSGDRQSSVDPHWFCRHAIDMLHFDSHLVHLRSSVFWMKLGQLLVYDTDDSLQAAGTRLQTSNLPVPPLLSLQGGCHRCAVNSLCLHLY